MVWSKTGGNDLCHKQNTDDLA